MLMRNTEQLPSATVGETLAVIRDVVLPNLAKGVIKHRPAVVKLSERFSIEKRAVHLLARLRNRYGGGPVLLKLPFRRHGLDRADRREFNEQVLEPHLACHRLAANFVDVVQEEATAVLHHAHSNNDTLDWEVFSKGWFRAVRRIVLGDSARDDEELTHMLDSLRSNANWAFLHPRQTRLRKRFMGRLRDYVNKGEHGSLAGAIRTLPDSASASPEDQMPHWLFAFDPAGMATFRTLALLATHPEEAELADMELAYPDSSKASKLPYLRSCVLESLRLWPTTPLILRESTRLTHWKSGALWAGSNLIIFTPFFHRDSHHLPAADQFDPGLWLTDEPDTKIPWPVLPFSDGPAMCPGKHVVLLATSHMVGAIWKNRRLHLHHSERLTDNDALPATLDNYSLRFSIAWPCQASSTSYLPWSTCGT